jgi:hypothetical protein
LCKLCVAASVKAMTFPFLMLQRFKEEEWPQCATLDLPVEHISRIKARGFAPDELRDMARLLVATVRKTVP